MSFGSLVNVSLKYTVGTFGNLIHDHNFITYSIHRPSVILPMTDPHSLRYGTVWAISHFMRMVSCHWFPVDVCRFQGKTEEMAWVRPRVPKERSPPLNV